MGWRRQQENCSANTTYKCCTTLRPPPQWLRQIIKLNSKQQQQRWKEAWYHGTVSSFTPKGGRRARTFHAKLLRGQKKFFSFPQKLSTWLLTLVKESWPQSQHSTSDEQYTQVGAKQDSEKATGTKSANLVHRKR